MDLRTRRAALVACRELCKQRNDWYWQRRFHRASVRTRGHCSSWTRVHVIWAAHAERVHTHPCAREHVSTRAGLPWEKRVPPGPAEGTAPSSESSPAPPLQTGMGGPPAPRISTVPDPWVPEPASTPGSQAEENTGQTLGRGSRAPLPAINSLEFTLALYIITRLFTAF